MTTRKKKNILDEHILKVEKEPKVLIDNENYKVVEYKSIMRVCIESKSQKAHEGIVRVYSMVVEMLKNMMEAQGA